MLAWGCEANDLPGLDYLDRRSPSKAKEQYLLNMSFITDMTTFKILSTVSGDKLNID